MIGIWLGNWVLSRAIDWLLRSSQYICILPDICRYGRLRPVIPLIAVKTTAMPIFFFLSLCSAGY